MPRLSSVPKYRKHRASGQAVVTLNGKDFYLGPHGSKISKMEYDRLVAEWLQRGRTVVTDADGLTVVELIAAYRKYAKDYYRKDGKLTGEYNRIQIATDLLRKFYGREDVASFGPVALRVIQDEMVKLGWARKTINDQVRRIVRMFKWGVSREMVAAMTHQALTSVGGLKKGRSDAAEGKPVKPVDDNTVDATLPHLPAIVADMVRFQRHTGARPSEVCSIRPRDIDRSGEIWRYEPESHKTEHHDKERIVFIGPRGQEILRPYLLRADDSYCFSPSESESKRRSEAHENRVTPLSCGNVPGSNVKAKAKRKAGKRYSRDSYRRAIHRGCDKAKLERWSPNRLRHTAATEIRSKFGLEGAQVALGHSNANITQVYAERNYKLAEEVAKEVG